MVNRFLVILSITFLLITDLSVFAEWTDKWDEKYYGIRHLRRYGKDKNGHKQDIHVVLIELTNPHVKIKAAIGKDKWGGGLEIVRSIASRHGAAVAVNADYWSNNKVIGSLCPEGTLVIEGYCYKANFGRSAIAFSSDLTRVEIGRFGPDRPVDNIPPDDCPSWIHNAVGAGPKFIYNGTKRWDEKVYQTKEGEEKVILMMMYGLDLQHSIGILYMMLVQRQQLRKTEKH